MANGWLARLPFDPGAKETAGVKRRGAGEEFEGVVLAVAVRGVGGLAEAGGVGEKGPLPKVVETIPGEGAIIVQGEFEKRNFHTPGEFAIDGGDCGRMGARNLGRGNQPGATAA